MTKKITFPHIGSYYIPIKYFRKKTTLCEVIVPPKITKKTIELGAKYSPDSVCVPFKYNLGNFIETLENGANILFTAGGGCRYRYYAEVTEVILRDLNYNFEFYKLFSGDYLNFREVYRLFKKINPKLSLYTFIHNAIYTILFIWQMDKIDKIIRKNIGFEKKKKQHITLKKEMLKKFKSTNSILKLILYYWKYKHLFKKIPIDKPKDCLKVGIIGELYTAMEPFSSYFLEKELANMNIEIKRYTNLSYLLWQKN